MTDKELSEFACCISTLAEQLAKVAVSLQSERRAYPIFMKIYDEKELEVIRFCIRQMLDDHEFVSSQKAATLRACEAVLQRVGDL